MLEKLRFAVSSVLGRLQHADPDHGAAEPQPIEDPLIDVEFSPIGPNDPAPSEQLFLCPVTRQELKRGDRIYQCRACHTALSEIGWKFLQQTDRSRCCNCRLRNTIRPVPL